MIVPFPLFTSKPPHHLAFAWLTFSLVSGDTLVRGDSLVGRDSLVGGDSLVSGGVDILLAGKHAHQARENVPVHNSLCEWLNVLGDVHPHVKDRLVRRVKVRGAGLRQDLCALRQVVDVEDPQEAQPHVLAGVVL